jgi:hypothetical protein
MRLKDSRCPAFGECSYRSDFVQVSPDFFPFVAIIFDVLRCSRYRPCRSKLISLSLRGRQKFRVVSGDDWSSVDGKTPCPDRDFPASRAVIARAYTPTQNRTPDLFFDDAMTRSAMFAAWSDALRCDRCLDIQHSFFALHRATRGKVRSDRCTRIHSFTHSRIHAFTHSINHAFMIEVD